MGWESLSSQRQGNVGIGKAISYFTECGYIVSLPLNDCQDYDIVVEIDGILKKIQVKTTRFMSRHGKYKVSLKSCGGTAGIIYHRVNEGSCDFVFVHCENGDSFMIPNVNLPSAELTLSGK